nr:YfhO family protein [Flavobacteriales bacterium]
MILEAGHNSKANAIGYMPMVLGATILLFRDKAWWGGALLALFLGLEIAMNHVQVTYYMGIVLLLFALAEAVGFVRAGRVGELVQRAGIGVVAVVLALLCNFGSLWSTWEYGKYTTRGRSELTILPDGSAASSIRTDGLDRDYVTAWSYGKQESFTLLVPNTKGGASGSIIRSQEDLQAIKDPGFRNAVLKEYQSGGYINSYWGDQRFTSGPVYIGALVVLLMLLALARAEGPARWWVLGAVPLIAVLMLVQSPVVAGLLMLAYLLGGMVLWRDGLSYALFSGLLLTLVLSWGRNYMPLTDFFLDMVPGYSKFRAVTIILIIVELAAPVLAIRYLDERLRAGAWDKATEKRDLLVGGGLVVLLLAFALMPTTFLRSLAFVLAGLALLWLHGRGKVGRAVVVGAMGLLVLVDLWVVDKRYVNNDKERGRYLSWEDERASRLPFKPTAADKAILQAEWSPAADAIFQELLAKTKAARAGEKGRDRMVGKDEEELLRFAALRRAKDHRVLTLADPFNDSKVSYFHKSVGGYHGAKLKRYQELIEFHLSPAMQRVITALQTGSSIPAMDSLLAREGVLNMLNTRHLIYSNERAPITNTNALGSAWFVDELRWMKNADEEITTLGTIDPARTALVDERQRELVGSAQAVADPSASIELEQYATNELRYRSRSAQGGIAVLSAIWYGPDWQAYIDGKPAPHFRANYVLRGIALPAGEHEVVFKLESRSYRTG